MSDAEMLEHLKYFPYKSMYLHSDAYEHAEYRVSIMQGARYMQTGHVSPFTKSPIR